MKNRMIPSYNIMLNEEYAPLIQEIDEGFKFVSQYGPVTGDRTIRKN